MTEHADVIVVGTGFASSFFLHRFLERTRHLRVLVLEAGPRHPHATQVRHRAHGSPDPASLIQNRTPDKPWVFTQAFGGGSNCWWACTPRMLPEDFELATRYGVGVDWPVTYDQLEPYYCDAEDLMGISGPEDSPFPRSRPYPQPPHRLQAPDRVLQRAHPGRFFVQPTARARVATPHRPACCGNGVCDLCPIDAKFTVENTMSSTYADPRVTLRLGARVQRFEHAAGRVTEVVYQHEGRERRARCDLLVLGANAMFNPHILLSSGLEHPELGAGVTEQVGITADVYLDGLDALDGSTSITGHAYTSYMGPHRAERAGCLIETYNVPRLRLDTDRWRQRLYLVLVYEDLRRPENHVRLGADPDKPAVTWTGPSDWCRRGLAQAEADLLRLVAPLPVERVELHEERPTEAHVLCSAPMGHDPATSVVDADGVHHQLRNLLVLGGSMFPTAAPANPSLTIAALALRAADRLTA